MTKAIRQRLNTNTVARLRRDFEKLGTADKTYWDSDVVGFGLRLRQGGSAIWIFQYQRSGVQGKVRIGDASVMGADEARRLATTERGKRDSGRDPAKERAEAKLKDRRSLRSVFDGYLQDKANDVAAGDRRETTLREDRRYLLTTFKDLHRISAHKITKADIARIVKDIAATKNPRTGKLMKSTAALALAHLTTALNWAVDNELIDTNPATNVTAPERGERDRVLNDRELASVWRACGDGSDPSRIVRLLILTGQRRDEISGMREEELDRREGSWTLPSERSKNKRAHTLTLPDVAWQIIGPPDRKGPLFGRRSPNGFTGWQMAKRALDERGGITGWTIHDLRRSFATGMAEHGIAPQHIVEAILNHVSGHKSGIAGIYNRATYQREMRIALDRWADHIRAITTGEKSNIHQFQPSRAG
ncbi:MAG: integrase arm-type DNA-binding domain-containing protein [Xanthobacteraceae bacterium]